MKPNSYDLALRDPALAAMLGVVGSPGSDFGTEYDYPVVNDSDFGNEYGWDMQPGAEFGFMGAEFGAAAPAAAAPPHVVHAALSHYNAARAKAMGTKRRTALLDPNGESDVKVERYTFPLNATIAALGTAAAITLSGQPDVRIRPQRVQMNAPAAGFVLFTEIKVANVAVTVGGGSAIDAFFYSAIAVDSHLDLPTLDPANKLTLLGQYTGFVPPGYVSGTAYTFVASFSGPARIAG